MKEVSLFTFATMSVLNRFDEIDGLMKFIKSPVYTTILGCAASMGAVIASKGDGAPEVGPWKKSKSSATATTG